MTVISTFRNASFLDTSYLLALELSSDRNHSRAQTHWNRVKSSLPPLLTTSYIFDEVVTFLNSRGHHAKAVQIGQTLLQSPTIHLLHVDVMLFHAAWDYFRRHNDKAYSLTDCISFVVMQQMGIRSAYTFDHHFTQAGYRMEP
ncbi:MAG: PIN domain-containing protein [Armatimonadetes bacterium]|nr:PIN domain-containing protein [Armatimonadota bacterium]